MRTTGGRMRVFVLLFAVAACVAASSVHASNGIRYGIQDDAWLEFGPGKLNQRLATFKRLGVPLVRFTLHWNEIALRRPTNPASPRDRAYDWRSSRPDPARPSPLRPDAGAHAGRHAGLGERWTRTELRATAAARLPRVRARRREALPVGSLLADLERAEPPALAAGRRRRRSTSSICSTPGTRRSTPCCRMPRSAAA